MRSASLLLVLFALAACAAKPAKNVRRPTSDGVAALEALEFGGPSEADRNKLVVRVNARDYNLVVYRGGAEIFQTAVFHAREVNNARKCRQAHKTNFPLGDFPVKSIFRQVTPGNLRGTSYLYAIVYSPPGSRANFLIRGLGGDERIEDNRLPDDCYASIALNMGQAKYLFEIVRQAGRDNVSLEIQE